MQDAPRIKHVLKTSVLDDEAKGCPATPGDILARCVRAFTRRGMMRGN